MDPVTIALAPALPSLSQIHVFPFFPDSLRYFDISLKLRRCSVLYSETTVGSTKLTLNTRRGREFRQGDRCLVKRPTGAGGEGLLSRPRREFGQGTSQLILSSLLGCVGARGRSAQHCEVFAARTMAILQNIILLGTICKQTLAAVLCSALLFFLRKVLCPPLNLLSKSSGFLAEWIDQRIPDEHRRFPRRFPPQVIPLAAPLMGQDPANEALSIEANPISLIPLVTGTEASERFLESEAHGEHLLPGIPNEITLELITPKMSWREFPILASVNKAWLHAVRSGNATSRPLWFDAVVHCHSTETLVLLSYKKVRVTSETSQTSNVIALYSPKENVCIEVPPIPCYRDGLPLFCQFVALDGNIYVVGGAPYEDPGISSEKVYVFDLAGEREWKECASMNEPRANFGCGVLGGKIYTFGGDGLEHIGLASEVYDPTTNIWSPIAPMLTSRNHHRVFTVGEELVDQNGEVFEVYHPVRNEWSFVSTHALDRELFFTAQRKLYCMGDQNICRLYDGWNVGWSTPYRFSFAPFWPPEEYDDLEGWPAAVLVVDNELLVLTKYREMVIILQSKGFGVESGEITWQVKGELPFSAISSGSYCMHSIGL